MDSYKFWHLNKYNLENYIINEKIVYIPKFRTIVGIRIICFLETKANIQKIFLHKF